jgi:lipid-A-disaccharide synthase
MLLKRPMVVAYIISGLTHRLYRLLGLRKLPHFALPNLLAGRELFPEYLQREVRAEVLGPALEAQLARSADRLGWYDAVTAIHGELRRGASRAAAAAVLALLDTKIR